MVNSFCFMQPVLIILTICAYFAILMTISHFTSKKADNSTYFIGNRKMPWLAVALAMITAPISGVTYVSVPGMVATKGYGYLQMCMGFIVGYFIIALVLVPLYYKHNIVSIYSFLEERYGRSTYKTGAWFFLISKVLGTSVKFLVVCMSLQILVYEPLGVPFFINVLITMVLIGLYTSRGGVKTVIWADMFKSVCLVVSVGLCLFFISKELGSGMPDVVKMVASHPSSQIFFLDNPWEGSYFWKQFIAGVFLVVAMTGLDQDMMQHTLSCKDTKSSCKNLYLSSFLQFAVICLFLVLGTLLITYMETKSIARPELTDNIFSTVAFHEDLPAVVGVLFVIGLISSSYSSVGSALTSLTTTYAVDILEVPRKYDEKKAMRIRKYIHLLMVIALVGIIIIFHYLNSQDAITAVFTLASYSYGPILGLFIFGIFSKKRVEGRVVGAICFLAPVLSWMVQTALKNFAGYETGFELLLINASIIIISLSILPSKEAARSEIA